MRRMGWLPTAAMLLVGIGVLMILLVVPGTAYGATVTVPDDYPTINSAVENATDYDTLFIREGNYTETVVIWRPLTVMGESRDGTIIWSEDPFAVLIVSHRTSISRLTVGGTTVSAGLILQATGCTVEDVTVKESLWGLWVNRGDNNVIRDVDCVDNQWQGLLVEEADHTLLDHVTCSGNNEGIQVRAAVDTLIQDCVSENNRVHGLRVERLEGFYETKDIQVIGCTMSNNSANGMEFSDTDRILVEGCTVADSTWSAIRTDRCNDVTIRNCKVINYARLGIGVQGGDVMNCLIEDNVVLDEGTSWSDVVVHGVEYSTIRNNTVKCQSSAISVLWANNTLVSDNTVESTNDNESFESQGVIVGRHRAGVNMPPHNVTLLRNVVSGFTEGIHVRGGWSINIIDCTVTGAEVGINFHVFDYGDDPIVGGQVRGCTLDGCGMVIEGMIGVLVQGNLISGADVGASFNASSREIVDNEFMDNTFRDCIEYGVLFIATNGSNLFHFNAFINNTVHCSDPSPRDDLDDGKYGNYWDDYEEKYPDASIQGVVWNTHYAVNGSPVKDRKPLAYPYDYTDPVADAGADQVVEAGTEVTLDASGSTDDMGIVEYVWSFEHAGVPVELTGESVTFTFRSVFEHNVTLTVVDAWGNGASDNVTITVYDDEPPVAAAGDDVQVGIGESLTLNANASTDNGWILAWKWVIDPEGAAIILEGETVDVSFTIPGEVLIALSVQDEAGNVGGDSLTVTVLDTVPPVADAGPDQVVDQGAEVTLYGGGSTDNEAVDTWTWTFHEDGEPVILDGETALHTFNEAGEYSVTLNVTDEAGSWDTDTVTVTVRASEVPDTEPPVADAGENQTVYVDERVTFDGSGSTDNVGIVSARWYIAVGNQVTVVDMITFQRAFDAPGVYVSELEVFDAAGNADRDFMTVTVLERDPVRAWSLGPFKDDDDSLGGVRVEVEMNGTTYVGYTDDDGQLDLEVAVKDLVEPVTVKATKEGWKDLRFEVELDSSGDPETTPPTMDAEEVEEAATDWLAWGLVIVLILAFGGTLLYLSNVAKGADQG